MLAHRLYPGQSQLDTDDRYLLPWALPHTDNLGIQSCTLSAITPPSGVPSGDMSVYACELTHYYIVAQPMNNDRTP